MTILYTGLMVSFSIGTYTAGIPQIFVQNFFKNCVFSASTNFGHSKITYRKPTRVRLIAQIVMTLLFQRRTFRALEM